MLKSIKNFMSKKKKIISLFGIMLVSSLFFTINVKADTFNNSKYYNFDDNSYTFLDTFYYYQDKLNSLNNLLSGNSNSHNYKYYITFGYSGSYGNYIELFLLPTNFISNPSSSNNYNYCFFENFSADNLFYNQTGCWSANNIYTYIYSPASSSGLGLYNNFNNYINDITSDLTKNYNSIEYGNTNNDWGFYRILTNQIPFSNDKFVNNELDYYNYGTYFNLPYSSNIPIYTNNLYRNYNRIYYSSKIGSNVLNSDYFQNVFYNNNYKIPARINFDETSNTEVVNETTYTYSKNITINYEVNSSVIDNYFYLYSLDEGNSWVTVSPSDDNVSWTLRVDSNKNVIGRILDKNTLENVYTSTYVVDGISKYEGLKHVVFVDNSYLNNGQDELYSFNIINYNSSKSINFQMIIDSFDETIEHVPRLIRTKGYIYNSASNSFLENSNVYFDNLSCTKESFSATRMVCTGSLKSNLNGTSRYEFYFDNVDNVYIDYYDDANSNYRTYNYTDSFLKDYDKYYFNMNSDKVYISPNNINQENKEGSIIIPYYFVDNDDLKIELLDYDYTNDSIIKKYSYLPTIDEYYRKFDFKLTDNSLPVLTNKKGKYCVAYYTKNQQNLINMYQNGNFFEYVVSSAVIYGSLGNAILPISDCAEEEHVYFYVSKDFKVTQNIQGSNEDMQITDNNYHIITTIDDNFNNSNTYEIDNANFFDSVKNAFSYFTSPIREILKMITYIWNSLNIILKMFIIFIFVFIVGLFALRFLL